MQLRRLRHESVQPVPTPIRLQIFVGGLIFCFICILARLFYFQIIQGQNLEAQAMRQYAKNVIKRGLRGSILTSDNYPLAFSRSSFDLVVDPSQIKNPSQTTALLAQFVQTQASEASNLATQPAQLTDFIQNKLTQPSRRVVLLEKLNQDTKDALLKLNLAGLYVEPSQKRVYPEGSMAAKLLGFVGKNDQGEDIGYFGLEGGLDRELKGREVRRSILADALGLEFGGSSQAQPNLDGRQVTLTIRRDVQFTVENMLKTGVEKYEALAGEVIVMDPKTGQILGMANYPEYQPDQYSQYEGMDFKNSAVSAAYEPGSTFKVLTVSAGIDSGAINPDTVCTQCAGPKVIDKYTIKTWNDVYNPNITMTQALAKSDNTAMIFASGLMGESTFRSYLNKFLIGQPSGLELQEDTSTPFPKHFGPVELATASFGQGISITSLQLVRAIGAIANQGLMMQPQVVKAYSDQLHQKQVDIPAKPLGQVIKPETAQQVSAMMVESALHGEAQWTASRTHRVAGKTGTSQIPIAGGYDPDRTIASFIGFAPPENPRFVMLVKLVEPKTSPWAAETAAPLWYQIADRLYLLLEMPPDVK